MVDAFKPAGGRQVIIQFPGLLGVGEEYDLPAGQFTQGSACRIDRVLGQANGHTKYLATMVSGQMVQVGPRCEVERVARNRRPVDSDQVDAGGGGTPVSSPMDWNAFQDLEEDDLKQVVDNASKDREASGEEERIVLRPEHYARAMGRDVDDQDFMVDESTDSPAIQNKVEEPKPVDGGRRSRYKDKWVRGKDGNLHRTEKQADNPFKLVFNPAEGGKASASEPVPPGVAGSVKFGVIVRPKGDGDGK